MILLAIDASTKATGIAIFDDVKLIHYECIQCNFGDVLDRIVYMTGKISDIYYKYRPDKIVMQEVLPQSVGHNQNVYKALIYLQAAIVITFHNFKKDIKLVVASHWRKMCGIKTGSNVSRQQLKRKSINLVEGIYNIEVNDDISDAICLGLAELKQESSLK